MKELERVVSTLLNEAKGKKKKKGEDKDPSYVALPKEYGYSDSFDFSQPLDQANLYKNQGQVNWGTYTADGSPGESSEKKLRAAVREAISKQSPWFLLGEALRLQESKERIRNAWALAEELLPSASKKGNKK